MRKPSTAQRVALEELKYQLVLTLLEIDIKTQARRRVIASGLVGPEIPAAMVQSSQRRHETQLQILAEEKALHTRNLTSVQSELSKL